MALESVELNPGMGGRKIGTDRIGTDDYEVVKQAYGVEGDLKLVSNDTPLPVVLSSYISTPNSSTTNLDAGNSYTFTSAGELTVHPDVMVNLYADQPTTVLIQFSQNGTDWDSTLPKSGAAGFNEFTTAVKGKRYVRIVVSTDSLTTTVFRLQTQFGTFRQGNAPLSANIANDADALIVRSVNSDLDLALGRFGGMLEDGKFGSVFTMDAANPGRDVWSIADNGSAVNPSKTFPSSAATLYIASSDNSDTMNITVFYLDANGDSQSITTALTGQTGKSLGITGIDCNRAVIPDNAASNAGNIYVTNSSSFSSGVPTVPSSILAYISIGDKQTQQALDQVPTGKKYYIKRVIGFCSRANGAAGSCLIRLQIKKNGGDWTTKRKYPLTTAAILEKTAAGLVFDSGTQIRAHVDSVSDNGTNITFEWHYDLVDI